VAPYAQCDELSPLHPITKTNSLPSPIGVGLWLIGIPIPVIILLYLFHVV
jgi:hypothetical protein